MDGDRMKYLVMSMLLISMAVDATVNLCTNLKVHTKNSCFTRKIHWTFNPAEIHSLSENGYEVTIKLLSEKKYTAEFECKLHADSCEYTSTLHLPYNKKYTPWTICDGQEKVTLSLKASNDASNYIY